MIIQNNSSRFKKINGVMVRAWRTIEVPDNYVLSENEIIVQIKEQIKKQEEVSKPKVNYDINNDGKFDEKDISLAAKILGETKKKHKK
jgi:hypothetical protein